MKGSTHLAAGLLAGALCAQIKYPGTISTEIAIGIGLAGLVGLVPDWVQVNLPGATSIVRGVFGHRGISHWFLTALAAWGVAMFSVPRLAPFVLAGWVSHICVDILSGGIPALWPWPGKITLANIKTGSALDTITGAACLVLSVTLIIWRLV